MWVMTSNTIERLAIMDEIRMAREQWETMAKKAGHEPALCGGAKQKEKTWMPACAGMTCARKNSPRPDGHFSIEGRDWQEHFMNIDAGRGGRSYLNPRQAPAPPRAPAPGRGFRGARPSGCGCRAAARRRAARAAA